MTKFVGLRIMNHPGTYISLCLILILACSVWLMPNLIRPEEISPVGYVCPPCGCSAHDQYFELPGHCDHCGMPLINRDYPSVKAVEFLFTNEDSVAIFHQKILYPAYFLALFIGLLTLWQLRRESLAILFLFFFLSHILFAFKNQLSGTSYSMHAPMRWLFFPLALLLMTSPALYLYIRQYPEKKRKLDLSDWFHFLPGILVMLIETFFFLGPESWRDFGRFNGYDHYPGLAEQITFVFTGVYYWWLAKKLLAQKNDLEPARKTWLNRLLIIQLLLIGLWILMLSVNFSFYSLMSTSLDYHLIWLTVALFALWGGYWIVFKREVIFPNGNGGKKEYRIATEELERLKTKLEKLMQTEKPYLQPDLSLQMLAEKVDLKEKELSELLNAGFESNFYNYINQYRIEEVKTMLLDPEKQHLSNYGIAQEAGFSSKSTFFNLFKKHVGMTPGVYKKEPDL